MPPLACLVSDAPIRRRIFCLIICFALYYPSSFPNNAKTLSRESLAIENNSKTTKIDGFPRATEFKILIYAASEDAVM
jgi:hypothetical protein